MVRQPIAEQQTLMSNSMDRRRSTRIPLDNRNSRILRQSLANYQGQPANLQDELVAIKKIIDELRVYNDGVPSNLPIEDEQMHAVEGYMKSVGCSACRIRSQLRHMEPRCESTSSVETPQSTSDRRASYCNTRYTQYHSQASTFHCKLETYKDVIESYYHKLVSSTQHRPMSYWEAEDNAEPVYTLLTESNDAFSSALNVKQLLSAQLQDISEREKRIREWHKLLSTTFRPKVESDDDCSSASSPLSYETDLALTAANDYKDLYNHQEHTKKNRRFSRRRLGLAFLLTMGVVVVLLGAVGVVLFYYGGFKDTQQLNTTSSDAKLVNTSTNISTTVRIIQAVITKTPGNATRTATAATTSAPTGRHSTFMKTKTQFNSPTSFGATGSKTINASTTTTASSTTTEFEHPATANTTSATPSVRRDSSNSTAATSERPPLVTEPEMTRQPTNTTDHANVTKSNASYTTAATNITQFHATMTTWPTSIITSNEKLDRASAPTSVEIVTANGVSSSMPGAATEHSTAKT